MLVQGSVNFGCDGPFNAPKPQPNNSEPPKPAQPPAHQDLNARNAAPTQIPTFTKHGHATYQNATFWMLMTVLPTIQPDSKPDVMILLRAILEGR